MMPRSVLLRLLPGLLAVAGLLVPEVALACSPQRIEPPSVPGPRGPKAPPASIPHPAAPAVPAFSADQIAGQQFRDRRIRQQDDYSPEEAIHDLHVGHFYLIQGDYQAALSRFRGALRHDPHLSEADFEAGQTELKLHQPEAARRYFQHYLEVDPAGKHAHKIRSILKKLDKKRRHA